MADIYMYSFMAFQCVALGKGHITCITFEWTLACLKMEQFIDIYVAFFTGTFTGLSFLKNDMIDLLVLFNLQSSKVIVN